MNVYGGKVLSVGFLYGYLSVGKQNIKEITNKKNKYLTIWKIIEKGEVKLKRPLHRDG